MLQLQLKVCLSLIWLALNILMILQNFELPIATKSILQDQCTSADDRNGYIFCQCRHAQEEGKDVTQTTTLTKKDVWEIEQI